MVGPTAAAVVAAVLLWAAGFKLLARSAPAAARRSALPRLVGAERAVLAYRVVGVAEVVVAVALALPGTRVLGALGAVGLSVGMLGYLAYARRAAPESSCGCMSAKTSPVSSRHFIRAGALLALSAGAIVPGAFTPWIALVGLMAVLALSPELDSYWLTPLRKLRVRVSHPLAGGSFEVPLDSTIAQLQKSRVYRAVADVVRSDLIDSWEEGEWRILTYSARRDGGLGPDTVVFAVPLYRYAPDEVRVVLLEGESVVV